VDCLTAAVAVDKVHAGAPFDGIVVKVYEQLLDKPTVACREDLLLT
jgi:hypothetical protein